MITKQFVIDIIARDKVVEEMIDKTGKGTVRHKEDLANDIYLSLLEKDEDLIVDLYLRGNLDFYISRIVTNNIRSKNSRYYYQYKRYDDKRSDLISEETNDDDDGLKQDI